MNRDVIIICESVYHGNTRKIAEAMAAALNCEIVNCEQASSRDLSGYQAVLLGSGIYFTSHHPKLLAVTENLHKNQKIIIFSTRGCPFVGKYHEALKEKLKSQGLSVYGEFSCRGFDCTGPYNLVHGGNKGLPNEGSCNKAKHFIRMKLAEFMPEPVKKTGAVTIDTDRCIGCGACQRSCLMNVFELQNGKMAAVREQDCVHCSKCIEACPQRCIGIYHSKRELIGIAKKFGDRKSLY